MQIKKIKFIKRQNNKKGQTLLEFAVLFVVVVSALVAMKPFIQQSFQGKLKETLDGMGKQYDPQGELHVSQVMSSNATTLMSVDTSNASGYTTSRIDETNTEESKTETITLD